MRRLSKEILYHYRSKTFRWLPRLRLHFERDAIRFVNERGFIFFWPVKDAILPSLWGAVAGDRSVPDNHDDPAHITWRWKDNLLGRHKWYYARVLRKRNTIISLKYLPEFYALSPNYGDPDNDYLLQYKQGLLPQEAKAVFEALMREGPLDTLALRKSANLTSHANNSRFNRALEILQADFRILPVGIAEAGTWKYAFVYDVFQRHFPEVIETAEKTKESEARYVLLEHFLISVGGCPLDEPKRLFKWRENEYELALNRLLEKNEIKKGKFILYEDREWLALDSLLT
jgi:hypothetical protein